MRVQLSNEPTGPGTYRLHAGVLYIIDFPAGIQVIQDEIPSPRAIAPDASPGAPRFIIMLVDAATGSKARHRSGNGAGRLAASSSRPR